MTNNGQLEETQLDIKDYIRILLNGKWWIIFITLSIFGLTAYKTITTHPTYQSDAVIMIEEGNKMETVFDFGSQGSSKEIANQIEILKSRYITEKTVKELWNSEFRDSLYIIGNREDNKKKSLIKQFVKKKFIEFGLMKQKPVFDKNILTEDRLEALVSGIIKGEVISVSPRSGRRSRRETSILDINVKSKSEQEAEYILHTFIRIAQNSDKEWSTAEISYLKHFLAEQIEKKETELTKAEDKVKNYMEQQMVFGVDKEVEPLLQQATLAETQYYTSEAELKIAENKKKHLELQLSEKEKTLTKKLSSSINARLLALRLELADREASMIRTAKNYGYEHNGVKATKGDIETIKQELRDETDRLISEGISVTDPLQFSQTLVEQMLTLDAELAGHKAKCAEYKQLMEMYNSELEVLPEKQLQYARLERNRIVLDNTYKLMRQKFEETSITEASEVGKIRIIDDECMAYKIAPKIKTNLMLGLIIGLGLGVGFIFLKDYMSNSIKTIEEIERTGQAILGVIPQMDLEKEKKYARHKKREEKNGDTDKKEISKTTYDMITHHDPKSPISEAYRTIRTNLSFSSIDKQLKSFLITSPGPGEGKTTTVSNLAITFANLGKRTLLIDGDLRRSIIHKKFAIERDKGLVQYLVGKEKDFDKLITPTEIDRLYVVTSGGLPPNPSELLGSKKMAELIDRLENEWDIILIDSPPVGAVTDSTMISKEIDQVILVVRASETDRNAFARAITVLEQVESPIGGVILNGISKATSYDSYYYYYQYYYYSDDGHKRRRKNRHKKFAKNMAKKIFG